MNCSACRATLSENDRFCPQCGAETMPDSEYREAEKELGRIGYSEKINDPAFARYIKNSGRWSFLFAAILSAAVIIGFLIYGETGGEMETSQALRIAFVISGMFFAIALLQLLSRKRQRTWDGVVVGKTVQKKSRRVSNGQDKSDYYIRLYTEYCVTIRDDKGKEHVLSAEDDDTVYHYYKIGDRVRHHAGLNSFEKYDKSRDSIVFCNACATLCSIEDEQCFRCGCPLLK